MIIDSHTHAWQRWPYKPPVPDDESRGKVEQLLYEMDQNNVDIAIIICARIDRNEDNNDYIADCIRNYPGRLIQFADVDCSWTKTYHTKGASDRLMEAAVKYDLKGYTHYLREDDDVSWFFSEDGQRFLQATADMDLIVSITIGPHQQSALRKIAQRYPSIPFLCHHIGGAKAGEQIPYENFKEILESAKVPNIYIKISGFAYVSQVSWEYPYLDTSRIVKGIYEHYGAERLCWGSDYRVVRSFMTYKHSIEALRSHSPFIPEDEKPLILGDNIYRLLTQGH